MMHGQKTSN